LITAASDLQALRAEVARRRTFAIISHPDAGKTTLTEKLLLYGGALREAGAVRAQKAARYATSDWLELEKQRGISVSSSVMHFDYAGHRVNILDTPGHKDFSEDTYRTLIAADSAVMLIDAGKGVESQTRKLFEVCRMSGIPIFTFINKMDRLGRDPLDLLAEIEEVLGIDAVPLDWPVGAGSEFRGVYDRQLRKLLLFSGGRHGTAQVEQKEIDVRAGQRGAGFDDGRDNDEIVEARPQAFAHHALEPLQAALHLARLGRLGAKTRHERLDALDLPLLAGRRRAQLLHFERALAFGREVGHAESVANEVAARADLGREPIEV